MSARNDEAMDMTTRLEGMIDDLKAVGDDDGEAPAFRELARKLFPIARMFESLGFMSIAREVSFVEKALERLDPESTGPAMAARPLAESARIQSSDAGVLDPDEATDDDEPTATGPVRRFQIPTPLGVVLIVFLVVILASILTVRRQHELVQQSLAERPTATAVPPSTPTSVPTPADPAADEWRIESEPEPASRAVIAEEISHARLALADGDLNRAISHVSAAALHDKTDSLVLDTAHSIVTELIRRADTAADNGEWEIADQYVEHARQIAIRFGLPDDEVVDASRRHRSMVRFRRLDPENPAAIDNAAGLRTIVYLKSGSTREGKIHGVKGRKLLIDRFTEIDDRGSKLYYTDEIAIDQVKEIRVYDE